MFIFVVFIRIHMLKGEGNMKLYDTSLKYMDAINAIGGTIVAVLTAALGTHWFLFVGFFNIKHH